MFYKIAISYNTDKSAFAAIAEVLELEQVPTDAWQFNDVYGTKELSDKLVAAGAVVELRRVKGIDYSPKAEVKPEAAAVNNATTVVSVSNHNLFEVTEVHWIENACTQELQKQLDLGWRILAVCPSNDARRPDYILGRKA